MFNDFFRNLISFFMTMPNSPLKKAIRDLFYGEVLTERIVEYPLIFANLNLKPSTRIRILDIGCYYSNFPISLASMGYSVTGVDLMDYELSHPNFKFIKGDMVSVSLPSNTYNLVTSISTLEHIGLGVYGDKNDLSADKKVMLVVHKILKENGRMFLTVPFGKKYLNPSFRSYDLAGIKALFEPEFRIQKMEYFYCLDSKWFPTDLNTMKRVNNKGKARGMAFIIGIKK